MLPVEVQKEVGAKIPEQVVQRADRYHRPRLTGERVYPLNRGVVVEKPLHVGHQRRGEIRGLQSTVGTHEQGTTKLLLQRADHAAQSLMRQIELVRRGLNVAAAVDLQKVRQLFLVHMIASSPILLQHFCCGKSGLCFCCAAENYVKLKTQKQTRRHPS